MDGNIPYQCVSMATVGTTLSYMSYVEISPNLRVTPTTSVVSESVATMLALPINGFNIKAGTLSTAVETTSSSPTSSPTITVGRSVVSIVTTTSSGAGSESSGRATNLSVTVGVSLGVSLGVLLLAGIAFFLFLCRRKRHPSAEPGMMPVALGATPGTYSQDSLVGPETRSGLGLAGDRPGPTAYHELSGFVAPREMPGESHMVGDRTRELKGLKNWERDVFEMPGSGER